jgi:hypothetical protein
VNRGGASGIRTPDTLACQVRAGPVFASQTARFEIGARSLPAVALRGLSGRLSAFLSTPRRDRVHGLNGWATKAWSLRVQADHHAGHRGGQTARQPGRAQVYRRGAERPMGVRVSPVLTRGTASVRSVRRRRLQPLNRRLASLKLISCRSYPGCPGRRSSGYRNPSSRSCRHGNWTRHSPPVVGGTHWPPRPSIGT